MIFFIFSIIFLIVYYDARLLRQHEEGLYQRYLQSSPVSWGILCGLIFILGGPFYLWKRKCLQKELKRRFKSEGGFWGETSLQRFSDSLGVILTWLLCIVCLILVIKGLSVLSSIVFKTQLEEMLFFTLLESLVMLVLIYDATRHYEGGFWKTIGMSKAEGSFMKIILVPALLGFLLAFWSFAAVSQDIHPPLTPLRRIIETTYSFSAILFFFGSAVFLAPLIEEIIFRGYFYKILSGSKGKGFAICVVAVIFSLLHVGQYWGDFKGILFVTLLGFVLTFLRAYNGVTVSSIVTHYVYNGFLIIFPLILTVQSNPAYFEYQFKYNRLDTKTKESLLMKSILAKPREPSAYNDLAWIYAGEGKNLDEALGLIEDALSLDPDEPA